MSFWAPTSPRAELTPGGIIEAVRLACGRSDELLITAARLADGARSSLVRLKTSLGLAELDAVSEAPSTFDAVTVMSEELDRLRGNIVRLSHVNSGMTRK